jgi:hypothetical protein
LKKRRISSFGWCYSHSPIGQNLHFVAHARAMADAWWVGVHNGGANIDSLEETQYRLRNSPKETL